MSVWYERPCVTIVAVIRSGLYKKTPLGLGCIFGVKFRLTVVSATVLAFMNRNASLVERFRASPAGSPLEARRTAEDDEALGHTSPPNDAQESISGTAREKVLDLGVGC